MLRVDGKQVPVWIGRRLEYARRHGWTGTVLSGYRTRDEQARAAREYSERIGIPIAELYPRGVFASRHLGRRWPDGAVDVTDPAGLARAMQRYMRAGGTRPLRGNGYALRLDPSHFSSDGH